jgi:hypothetical protein
LEEVSAYAGHEAYQEVDGNIFLIDSDPQEILDQKLRPHPILSLNLLY